MTPELLEFVDGLAAARLLDPSNPTSRLVVRTALIVRHVRRYAQTQRFLRHCWAVGYDLVEVVDMAHTVAITVSPPLKGSSGEPLIWHIAASMGWPEPGSGSSESSYGVMLRKAMNIDLLRGLHRAPPKSPVTHSSLGTEV